MARKNRGVDWPYPAFVPARLRLCRDFHFTDGKSSPHEEEDTHLPARNRIIRNLFPVGGRILASSTRVILLCGSNC